MSGQSDHFVRESMAKLLKYLARYNSEYSVDGKLPKAYVWRPYRFALKDIVLGRVVIRHNRNDNTVDVAVCLCEDHPDFEDHNGTKFVCAFLLSEAFMCGSSMTIRFVKEEQVEGETKLQLDKMPDAIIEYVNYLGVKLNHISDARITP